MPGSPIDSTLYRDLMGDREVGALFTDSAELRALLIVEGTLAKVQGQLAIIPNASGEVIHRAGLEAQIDPSVLSKATGDNAVPVPALVSALRAAIDDEDHAQYVHFGATSQDIVDTALTLRLRQVLDIADTRLTETVRTLGVLAEAHAETPMAGRTYGQIAVPTSFGAVVSAWGRTLLAQHADLPMVRNRVLVVSLSGAAGTLSAMGDKGPEVRAALADALSLGNPGATWHGDRGRISALAGWLTAVCAALGKMGEDLLLLTQSGIDEVSLSRTGLSSTMPQKANPVLPSLLVSLGRMAVALNGALQGAALHRQERDGAAWMTEWLALPQLCLISARSLAVARDLASAVSPNPDAMRRNLDANGGTVYAEHLTFALARTMPRPEAQAAVFALVARARAGGHALSDLALTEFPELPKDLFDPRQSLGSAPQDARDFATEAARA